MRSAARAFEAGDFSRVAALTRSLRAHPDPAAASAARALYRAVDVDPFAWIVLGACAAGLIAIAWSYGR